MPDWLVVADRRVRIRWRDLLPWLDSPDPHMAALAQGIAQHLQDDARFHGLPVFVELSARLALEIRDHLDGDPSFRPAFLGHLLVELLLDAALAAEDPGRLTAYYQSLAAVEPRAIERMVNRIGGRSTTQLARFIERFRGAQVLWDYLGDRSLLRRLNQIMNRVGFEPLPDRFVAFLPVARELVASRWRELLEGIPTTWRLAALPMVDLPNVETHGTSGTSQTGK